MRINFILTLLTGLFLGLILFFSSGALSYILCGFGLLFIVISAVYMDSGLLFFLGARGLKRADEAKFHHASAQEAYKLAVPVPRLYFYNGTLDRAFVLQGRGEVSLILSRELLENCNFEEISSICFALLLQVKKNVVKKRNKVLFLIGLVNWLTSFSIQLICRVIPSRHLELSLNWVSAYLLRPWLELLFKVSLGDTYFEKINKSLAEYPQEQNKLMRVAGKIYRPNELDSITSKKIWEFSSLGKNANFQRIIGLELLPHEWDFIFKQEAIVSA